jgi:hypothetical protein
VSSVMGARHSRSDHIEVVLHDGLVGLRNADLG